MKAYNNNKSKSDQVSVYGLDVYSLFESMQTVVDQLKQINPELAKSIHDRYACFDAYEHDEQEYARSLLINDEGVYAL